MIDQNKPNFITFEGCEGSGKSTQSKMLHEYLLSKNIKSIHTREVGGTPEAERIRDLLVYSELMPVSELMLVMAARYEHINKVIIPALNDGCWVICDRFIDSTVCYQSGKETGLTPEMIYRLHKELMKANHDNRGYKDSGIMPDLTFFMDVPPDVGLARAGLRGNANKFEEKDIAFHLAIYSRFKEIASLDQERFISIDADGKSIEEIHQEILDKIFT
jgi:dTMP kinase